MTSFFDGVRLFAIDLDGTVYEGDDPIAGAVEAVEAIRKRYEIVFLTNSSGKTPPQVREKLSGMGIESPVDDVYTASAATAAYLQASGLDRLYVIGSSSFRRHLAEAGFRICDDETAEHLVVGLDLRFTYEKISVALSILMAGGTFVACNEDPRFPVGGGRYRPACGAMVGAIAACSGRGPDVVVGKPNTYMLDAIGTRRGLEADGIVVVGDSYGSDIAMARAYGSRAVFLSTGESAADPAVLTLRSISEIPTYLKEG